ncbi:MAG TPA: hypothetical protein VFU22_11470 [Roseiflexaceae bacterium]|nr:hypothetical protein [Roseiflexaceae bacterium]
MAGSIPATEATRQYNLHKHEIVLFVTFFLYEGLTQRGVGTLHLQHAHMEPLAYSPAGAAGGGNPREYFLLLLFASEAGKKKQQKDRSLERFALQTSQ